ncbi:MAG: hypothetical protein M1829_004611 [Trizodia sp. TS-e1964]|nr:MAG: hypothetical protein M1829_004611 [Trizodia sp. TS-e1964]
MAANAATSFPATDILPNSSISGFQFDNGESYRVFYQGNNGAIHAMYTNGGNNWVGGDKQIMVAPGLALAGTPLASAPFQDKNGFNSRTYYLGLNYQVRVVGVTAGRITDEVVGAGFHAAPYSTLGAIAWTENGSPHIRVYYQSPDDRIQEISWDGAGYGLSHTFPIPLKGTALAFINRAPKDKTPSIRGYYQHSDYRLMEICWDSGYGWRAGTMFNGDTTVPDRANISTCVTPNQPPAQMNTFWQHQGNTIYEAVWSSGWYPPHVVPNLTTAANGKFLACSWIPKGGNQTSVRIIFLAPDNKWADRRFENGNWLPVTDSASGTSGGDKAPNCVPADF